MIANLLILIFGASAGVCAACWRLRDPSASVQSFKANLRTVIKLR